jgi:hypothetical protein
MLPRIAGTAPPSSTIGQTLTFEPDTVPAAVEVSCLDEDIGRDTVLGIGCASGLALMPASEPWTRTETVALSDDRGRPTGFIDVVIEWGLPQGVKGALLHVSVVRGHGLVRDRPCGRYCLVRVGTATLRTHSVLKGGNAPEWQPVLRTRRQAGFSALPAIYDAASRGDVDTVLRTLTGGWGKVDVNLRPPGRHGNTALHRASSNGHVAVIRELIRARADINGRTDEGWTPFHCACHSGQRSALAPKPAPSCPESLLTRRLLAPAQSWLRFCFILRRISPSRMRKARQD